MAAVSVGLVFGTSGCANADLRPVSPTADAALADATADTVSPTDKAGGKSDTQSPGDNAPAGPCDPFSNAGCSSDRKCTAVLSNGSLVLSCGSKGSKSEGDECSRTSEGDQLGDDCGDGLACFKLQEDKSTSSTCRRFCPTSGTDHACPTGSVCRISYSTLGGYGFCGSSCKPLEQSGCSDVQACYLTSIGALCGGKGSTKIGDGCTGSTPNECEPGSTCVTGLSNGNKCLAFCAMGGGSPSCSSGTCTKMPVADVFMSEPNVGTCR